MQHRVCAYCGTVSSGLDVDHFRPKGAVDGDENHGGYWWLAYDFSNYLLGCTVCNQKRKRSRFPLEAGADRVTYGTRHTIQSERRVLLDPAEDPVEEWLALEWDDVTCRIVPHTKLGEAERERVQRVIDFFGLNLDPEVRKQRSKVYEAAVRAASKGRWEKLRRMAMAHAEHSFAARFVLLQQAPERLPTTEEELQDLVRQLWTDLQTQVREVLRLRHRGKNPSRQDDRQLDSLCWALTVLQSDPASDPALSPDLMATLLEQEPAEIREAILEAFRKLGMKATQ
jgi:uncharacterized protein (TIGR02646 family)